MLKTEKEKIEKDKLYYRNNDCCGFLYYFEFRKLYG